MRYFFLTFLIFILIGPAQAQLRKCVGPDGKVTYSDMVCSSNLTSAMVRPRDNTLDNSGQREHVLRQENEKLKERLSEAEKAPAQQSTNGRTQFDLQAEKSVTIECERAKRDYDANAGSINPNNSQVKAKRSAMYIACGVQEPVTLNANPRSALPSAITSCDTVGYWDNHGGRYIGAGNTFVGPNGRTCNRAGNMIQCQ